MIQMIMIYLDNSKMLELNKITMWSWTTAIACMNTNRNYIWFELDKWYFDIANKRISCK